MSQAARTERQIARDIGSRVGAAAALLVLAQVFVAASAAHANAASSAALQRSLVSLSSGSGALVDPLFAALAPTFVATYLAALFAFAGGLVLCWRAGGLTAREAGSARGGIIAGRRVMLVASAAWLVLALLAYVILQLDGTVSWLVGTLGAVVLAPSAPINGVVYSAHPTAAYIVVQLATLLLQILLGVLVAHVLGGLAGRAGARAAVRRSAPQPYSGAAASETPAPSVPSESPSPPAPPESPESPAPPLPQ